MIRVRCFLGLALLAAAIWLVAELALATREIRTASAEARALLTEANIRLVQTSQNANGVLLQLGLAADQWAQASREQREYWNRTAAETEATMRELRATAEQVNQVVVPQIVASLQANDKRLDVLTGEAVFALRQTVDNLAPVLEELGAAARGAAERMNDPALADTAQQLSIAAEQMARASLHIEQATDDVAIAVRRATRPVGLLKRSALLVLDVGAKLSLIFRR
jgi:hypothetical protein